jgi:hypothetical protein
MRSPRAENDFRFFFANARPIDGFEAFLLGPFYGDADDRQADDLGSVILNVDQDTLLLTNRVHINRGRHS